MQSNWDDLSETSIRTKRNSARKKYGDRLLTAHIDDNFIFIDRSLPAALLAVAEAIGEFDERN